jgi:hypothetical protein
MSDSDDEAYAPTEALIQLLSPDGYYTYLGIPKSEKKIEEDVVKKSYRKLSLKVNFLL